jgi:hypothetical protein
MIVINVVNDDFTTRRKAIVEGGQVAVDAPIGVKNKDIDARNTVGA